MQAACPSRKKERRRHSPKTNQSHPHEAALAHRNGNAHMIKIYHLHPFTSTSPTVSLEKELFLELSKHSGSVQTLINPLLSVALIDEISTNLPPQPTYIPSSWLLDPLKPSS